MGNSRPHRYSCAYVNEHEGPCLNRQELMISNLQTQLAAAKASEADAWANWESRVNALKNELQETKAERDAALESARVQNKACAEEMLKCEHMQKNWNTMVESIGYHHNMQHNAEVELDLWKARAKALEDELSRLSELKDK